MHQVRGRRIPFGNRWCQFSATIIASLFSIIIISCSSSVDGYNPTLRYPIRNDLLVVQVPPIVPSTPAAPGQLDESLQQFRKLGGLTLNPAELPPTYRQKLQDTLDALFGSPASPAISIEPHSEPIAGVDFRSDRLAEGSRLYRRHCVQCHGLSGDGRGPTGPWIYPYPRDFRLGIFKCSTHAECQGKPSVAALKRILRQGIPGSSMPIFDRLSETDIDAIIGYLIHLSLRGETEYRVLKLLHDADSEVTLDDIPHECRAALRLAWQHWHRAQTVQVKPGADVSAPGLEQIRRGYLLFISEAGPGCVKCHEDFGRAERYRYDVWGGVNRVRDLTRGEYRWGHEPEWIAEHIRQGIAGAGMPGHPALTEEQLWDLVAFVLALPAPPRLPAELRHVIYPGSP